MAFISADLFPSKFSFIIFLAYMGLFINQGILVTASKSADNSYNYSTVTVVFVTECVKLAASICLYLKDHTVSEFTTEFTKYRQVLMLYFLPAALYCLYNNLQFTNLAKYDPTTYFLLLQLRVVATGVVFQVLFRKRLSRIQWASVLLLTVGCLIKEVNHYAKSATPAAGAAADGALPVAVESSVLWSFMDIHILLILMQVFCSCFAGVYNEYLLKDVGCDVHIMMANVYMYVQSILCSVLTLAYKWDIYKAFSTANVLSIFQPSVLAIICNNAAIGIVTSLFLRSLNAILKTFASALELMFTAVLCWMIFGIPIDVFTLLALVIVIAATLLYAQNPVVNKSCKEALRKAKQTDARI